MRRISLASTFAAAWALALLPDLAFASPEGGHGGGGLGDIEWFALQPDEHGRVGFMWVIVNFVVLLIVLNKLLFSKLSAGHKRNREQIKGELERATKARTEAESLMAEYEDKLVKLKTEVEDIREAAKKTAEEERKQILAEAEAEADKIKAGAVASAEREAERVRKDIEAEIIDRAVDAAEKTIRQKLGAADQRKMVDDYVSEVAAAQIGGAQ